MKDFINVECFKNGVKNYWKELILSIFIWIFLTMPYSLQGQYNIRVNFAGYLLLISFFSYLFSLYLTMNNKEIGGCLSRHGLACVILSLLNYEFVLLLCSLCQVMKIYILPIPTIFLLLCFLTRLRSSVIANK